MHTHLHLPTRRPHIPFFRIFYSTTFTTLSILLAAALLITPSDQIYQSIRADEIFHIFTIAGFYVLTGLIALLLYGGRLYKTRSALASIPRDRIGTEGKKIGKVIQEGRERSAWIAFEGRPRDTTGEKAESGASKKRKRSKETENKQGLESIQPVWGTISHPGWSSPSSPDLPNLHYEPVILELPHLIEAKAVSLAPPDPLFSPNENNPDPPPDPVALALLQRPPSTSLRSYITHLTTLSMINPPNLGTSFLTIYEQARFSGQELNEIEFRGMMSIFASLLRNMAPLDPAVVSTLHAELEEEEEEEEDSNSQASLPAEDGQSIATDATVSHTPLPSEWVSARPDIWTSSSSSSSSSPFPSTGTDHTAPSRRTGLHTPSIASLRRIHSNTTTTSRYSARSTAGSVIRLAEARGPLDLPYEYVEVDREGRE